MAADFIQIVRSDPNTAPFAQELIAASAQMRIAFETLKRIQGKGFNMFEPGPPADFAEFETLYGIPPGEGQTVFDLVNGSVMAMEGGATNDDCIELMNRVG
jgi:hypothetical protein